MSELFGMLAGKAGNDNLIIAIKELQELNRIQAALTPSPFIFLKSNNNVLSSNVTDGTLILSGPLMGQGQKGIVEDFNVNFTTVAGTVRLVIVDSENNIIIDILRDITSSTNGTGKTVLEDGQRLAIVGQTAGAGVFSIYCSGFIQQVIV